MGVATALIGVLPTYAQAGSLGAIGLVVLRLLQGIAVGGDWGGSATLSVEAAGNGKRLEDGKVIPLDVQVGDRILFGKYSGSDIKLDAEELLIMREDEVLGILDAQPVAAKKAS